MRLVLIPTFVPRLLAHGRCGVKVKAFRRKAHGREPSNDDELMLLARYLVLVAKREDGWAGLDHMDWKSELRRFG